MFTQIGSQTQNLSAHYVRIGPKNTTNESTSFVLINLKISVSWVAKAKRLRSTGKLNEVKIPPVAIKIPTIKAWRGSWERRTLLFNWEDSCATYTCPRVIIQILWRDRLIGANLWNFSSPPLPPTMEPSRSKWLLIRAHWVKGCRTLIYPTLRTECHFLTSSLSAPSILLLLHELRQPTTSSLVICNVYDLQVMYFRRCSSMRAVFFVWVLRPISFSLESETSKSF